MSLLRRNGREVLLGELCERVTVGHVGPMADQYRSSGTPFLRSQDIEPFVISAEGVKFIDEDFNRRLRKSALAKDDVVIVRTGYPGTAAVVPAELHGANCADLVILTPGPHLDPWFVAALFNSAWGRGAVAGNLVGVAQQHFNVGAAKSLRLQLPDISIQQRIGGIIRTYCDLIEVNSRRIAILEEMGRRIFDEWFVKFRFPHQTCASDPENWARASVGDVIESLESGSRPKGGVGSNGDVPSIGAENVIGLGRYNYAAEKKISREFYSSMRRGRVRQGDVMLYKDGAYIGRLSMAWRGFPHQECAVNEHVFLLRPHTSIPPQFLFFWLNQPSMQSKIRGLNANAAQPGLNQPGVKGLPIIIPPAPLLARFDAITRPVFDLLFNLARQNPSLREARDLLLPRLISGEIEIDDAVPGAEAAVERVAAE